MKIISWNVNGIRSVFKKGFWDWFEKENADIVCLQEIKINKEQLLPDFVNRKGYHLYTNTALKKGYSGVLIYTKPKPVSIKVNLNLTRFDEEGRFIELKYPDFTLINIYIPHGGREKQNFDYKLEVYRNFLKKIKRSSKKTIVVGDFNIAHAEIDLERPRQNKNNIMFTAIERKQISSFVNLGFVDTFRRLYGNKKGNYTWWPYMRNARQRNLGWRIDYCFVSKDLVSKVKNAFILPEVMGSDHCPTGIII